MKDLNTFNFSKEDCFDRVENRSEYKPEPPEIRWKEPRKNSFVDRKEARNKLKFGFS